MTDLIGARALKQRLEETDLAPWVTPLALACKNSLANKHGRVPHWLAQLQTMPDMRPVKFELNSAQVTVSSAELMQNEQIFRSALQALMPWRKGPFDLFGVHIDSEWRSDLKWQRIAEQIDLQGKTILDIGCGNGYYMWRMLGAGADYVLGVDPMPLYVVQFLLLNHFIRSEQLEILPLTLEELPPMPVFDVVFSMGVLYHRRSPIEHLLQLKTMLAPDGEVILETLVVDGDENTVFVPSERYAGMHNVWFLPSVRALKKWLSKCGYRQIKVLDVSTTTLQEQRQTKWMTSYSLNNFLDANNPNKTIEGHPAPQRASIKCTA